jgi:hypothetical protein
LEKTLLFLRLTAAELGNRVTRGASYHKEMKTNQLLLLEIVYYMCEYCLYVNVKSMVSGLSGVKNAETENKTFGKWKGWKSLAIGKKR